MHLLWLGSVVIMVFFSSKAASMAEAAWALLLFFFYLRPFRRLRKPFADAGRSCTKRLLWHVQQDCQYPFVWLQARIEESTSNLFRLMGSQPSTQHRDCWSFWFWKASPQRQYSPQMPRKGARPKAPGGLFAQRNGLELVYWHPLSPVSLCINWNLYHLIHLILPTMIQADSSYILYFLHPPTWFATNQPTTSQWQRSQPHRWIPPFSTGKDCPVQDGKVEWYFWRGAM